MSCTMTRPVIRDCLGSGSTLLTDRLSGNMQIKGQELKTE